MEQILSFWLKHFALWRSWNVRAYHSRRWDLYRNMQNGYAVIHWRAVCYCRGSTPYGAKAKRLYLFCGKRCDRIKALLWESDGFVLLYKRMEVQGRFRWPRNQLEVKQLTWQQFDGLMSGLEIEQPKAFKPTEWLCKTSMPANKNGELSTPCIISAIPCKYWVFCFLYTPFE